MPRRSEVAETFITAQRGTVFPPPARVLPIMRERLLLHFPGRKGFTVASVLTRIANSLFWLPWGLIKPRLAGVVVR